MESNGSYLEVNHAFVMGTTTFIANKGNLLSTVNGKTANIAAWALGSSSCRVAWILSVIVAERDVALCVVLTPDRIRIVPAIRDAAILNNDIAMRAMDVDTIRPGAICFQPPQSDITTPRFSCSRHPEAVLRIARHIIQTNSTEGENRPMKWISAPAHCLSEC